MHKAIVRFIPQDLTTKTEYTYLEKIDGMLTFETKAQKKPRRLFGSSSPVEHVSESLLLFEKPRPLS